MAKVLCIEIGVTTTRIVEMDNSAKKPTVYKYVVINTPQEAVEDGYLDPLKTDILAVAIKTALKENKIRTKRVIFTVFSGKIISREILLPAVRVQQIETVIKSNLSEYFPIQLDGYKVAHIYVNTIRDGDNAGKHRVLVLAAEELLLLGYQQLAERLGFFIVDIDYSGNSVMQAVKKLAGARPIMAVKLEDENAIISILHQGSLVLQRTINHAFGRLMESDADIEEATEVLVNTMLRIVDFYSLNDENEKIEEIIFVGEGSKEPRVIETVEKQMQIPCRVLDTLRIIELGKKATDMPVNQFATVIGAGISSVGFDNEREKHRHETNYPSACILIIVFYIVLLVAMWFMGNSQYQAALDDQAYYQNIKSKLAGGRELYTKHENMKTLRANLEEGQALTQNSNDHVLELFAELEEKLPSDAEVTYFLSDAQACEMSFFVPDKETAAGVIKTLGEFESISNVVIERLVEVYEDETLEENDAPKKSIGVEFHAICYYAEVTQEISSEEALQETETVVQE